MWKWALWLNLLTCVVHAADTAIDRAQAAALKKNRLEACEILNQAYTDTPTGNKAARVKLGESLATISRMFFTDKGQRAFESGQSLMFENPDMALTQLKEALATEDGNLAVQIALVKTLLTKNDCDGALTQITKARHLNPLASEPALLDLRATACQNNFALFSERAKQLPVLDKWEDQYLQYLWAQNYLQDKSPKKAFDLLTKVAAEQPAFPETFIFLARAATALDRDNENYLQKYVSLCKAVTGKERKRFSLEPRLCAHLKEAEDEIAKKPVEP